MTVYKETKYSNKYAKGEIIDQSIPPKEKIVLSQATVSFTVSLGAKNIMVRDLRGYSLKEVQDYAEESSLNLIIKRIDSDEPVNTVHHRLRVFHHHHHLQVLQMSKKTGD